MNRAHLVLLVVLLFSLVGVHAYPSPVGHVNDFADVIDPSSRGLLESRLADLQSNSSAEVAVVTVTSLDNEDIDSYAVHLFEAWGIGKKGVDNGLLILVAPNDRKWRIEVGYGLEGIVTDSISGRIGRAMVPYFKEGNFSAGIEIGVSLLDPLLRGEEVAALQDDAISSFLGPDWLLENLFQIIAVHWFISTVCFAIYQSLAPKGKNVRRPKKQYAILGIPWILVIIVGVLSWVIGGVLAVFTLIWLAVSYNSGNRGGGFSGGGLGGFSGGGSSGGFGGFGGGGSGGGGSSGGW